MDHLYRAARQHNVQFESRLRCDYQPTTTSQLHVQRSNWIESRAAVLGAKCCNAYAAGIHDTNADACFDHLPHPDFQPDYQRSYHQRDCYQRSYSDNRGSYDHPEPTTHDPSPDITSHSHDHSLPLM
jgi:hypothetical protein